MIISHRHKFIFFAVPKTGTHAIRFALRPLMGEEDEEQVGLYVNKSLPYASLKSTRHGHISTQQAKAALPAEVWDSYYKFAFVRNPFDRFVSFGFYMNRKNRSFGRGTNEKLKAILSQSELTDKILFQPQHLLLCDEQDRLMVDFVGRYENLPIDFTKVCARLDLSPPALEHYNATRHEHYSQYYDEELSKVIFEIYRKDFSIFGY